LAPALSVRDLTVRYEVKAGLSGVSFDVPAGGTLGIVGPIGSGKSTLLKALVRLVEHAAGEVRVGAVSATALDLTVLRRMFGYVPQNPMLFSKSIAENVAFGRPEAPRDRIEAALVAAAFDADLKVLPQGLDTPVGERGVTLSGGQKQRTAMARALLLDPPILLLDDALSAVDTETEARILGHLRQLRQGRTTLIVAHRISAVQHADTILVLDGGRVVEQGTHASLLTTGGIYAAMARRQELAREAAVEAAP
jgi:ABC-type multidrug transport system fused ATPase/permease subunit